jgi:ABC-2 type transport system permease protein
MMMMGRQPTPKGNIDALWELLGVKIDGTQAVWQEYQPIRQLPMIPKGFVFLDQSLEKDKKLSPFGKNDMVTSALQYMMLPIPGRITEYVPMMGEKMENPLIVTPLLQTFQQPAGIVLARLMAPQNLRSGVWEQSSIPESGQQNLAVRIQGELPAPPAPELREGETPIKPEPANINVILVADIDMLSDVLFHLRQMGNEPGSGINLDFDNVTFVLNAIDSVAGDERFLEVRSRRSKHRTLSKFDEHTEAIRQATMDSKKGYEEEFNELRAEEQKKFNAKMEKIKEDLQGGDVNREEASRKISAAMMTAEKRLEAEEKRIQREFTIKLEEADVKLNEEINRVQGQYKIWSVVLPPIPPLLIAFAVFFVRRIRESEGIPVSRRRK